MAKKKTKVGSFFLLPRRGGDSSFCLLALVLPSVSLLTSSSGLGKRTADNKEVGGTKRGTQLVN